jgi:hypothetical protein
MSKRGLKLILYKIHSILSKLSYDVKITKECDELLGDIYEFIDRG